MKLARRYGLAMNRARKVGSLLVMIGFVAFTTATSKPRTAFACTQRPWHRWPRSVSTGNGHVQVLFCQAQGATGKAHCQVIELRTF